MLADADSPLHGMDHHHATATTTTTASAPGAGGGSSGGGGSNGVWEVGTAAGGGGGGGGNGAINKNGDVTMDANGGGNGSLIPSMIVTSDSINPSAAHALHVLPLAFKQKRQASANSVVSDLSSVSDASSKLLATATDLTKDDKGGWLHRTKPWVTILVICVLVGAAIGLGVYLYLLLRAGELDSWRQQFQLLCNERAGSVGSVTGQSVGSMQATAAFGWLSLRTATPGVQVREIQADGSVSASKVNVTYSPSWSDYQDFFHSSASPRYLDRVLWMPYLTNVTRASWEERTGIQVKWPTGNNSHPFEAAPDRAQYFPWQYVWLGLSDALSQAFVGMDMFGPSPILDALSSELKHGVNHAQLWVTSRAEPAHLHNGEQQYGIVAQLPFFRNQTEEVLQGGANVILNGTTLTYSTSVEDRWADLIGVTTVIIRTYAVMSAAIEPLEKIPADVSMWDDLANPGQQFIARVNPHPAGTEVAESETVAVPLRLSNRIMTIRCRPSVAYVNTAYTSNPLIIAVGAACFILLNLFLLCSALCYLSLRRALHRSELLAQANKARGQALAWLSEAKAESERANASKSDFLAFLCHELRNPLHAVGSMIDFLQSSESMRLHSDAHDWECLTTIDAQVKVMNVLVNDALDLSKIEAGKMHFESIAMSLTKLAKAVVTSCKTRAQTAGLALHLHLDPDLPKVVYSDPTRLRQVLTNLLSNAIKFTQCGSVTLTVRTFEIPEWEHSDKSHSRSHASYIGGSGGGSRSSHTHTPWSNGSSGGSGSTAAAATSAAVGDIAAAAAAGGDGGTNRSTPSTLKQRLKHSRYARQSRSRQSDESESKSTSGSEKRRQKRQGVAAGHTHTPTPVQQRLAREGIELTVIPSEPNNAHPVHASMNNGGIGDIATGMVSTAAASSSSAISGTTISVATLQLPPPPTNCAPKGSGGYMGIEFICEDTGCGIAEEAMPFLFEPYSQAKLSVVRKHGGTGLGLNIIRQIIELLGGSIQLESRVHHGTRIIIQLVLPTRRRGRRGHARRGSRYERDRDFAAVSSDGEASSLTTRTASTASSASTGTSIATSSTTGSSDGMATPRLVAQRGGGGGGGGKKRGSGSLMMARQQSDPTPIPAITEDGHVVTPSSSTTPTTQETPTKPDSNIAPPAPGLPSSSNLVPTSSAATSSSSSSSSSAPATATPAECSSAAIAHSASTSSSSSAPAVHLTSPPSSHADTSSSSSATVAPAPAPILSSDHATTGMNGGNQPSTSQSMASVEPTDIPLVRAVEALTYLQPASSPTQPEQPSSSSSTSSSTHKSSSSASSLSSRPEILILDDQHINLRILARMLQSLGCVVVTAMDGQQGMEFVKQKANGTLDMNIAYNGITPAAAAGPNANNKPAVTHSSSPSTTTPATASTSVRHQFVAIFSDILMPNVDGLEFGAQLRQYESDTNLQPTPLCAMSANVLSHEREACFKAGFGYFLPKPFAIKDVYNLLKQIGVNVSRSKSGTTSGSKKSSSHQSTKGSDGHHQRQHQHHASEQKHHQRHSSDRKNGDEQQKQQQQQQEEESNKDQDVTTSLSKAMQTQVAVEEVLPMVLPVTNATMNRLETGSSSRDQEDEDDQPGGFNTP